MSLAHHIVVVGASLAGARAAEALRREGFDGRLTLVGDEAHLPYQRPPLSKQYLAGTWDRTKLDVRMAPDLDVELRLGTRATAVDLAERRVTLTSVATGSERHHRSEGGGDTDTLPFDGLVIATGCHPRTLPGTADLEGVHTLRSVDDADSLAAAFEAGPRVAIVGAGFIGSEVAATCRGRGMEVTVIEALSVPLSRVLGDEMGRVCGELHRDHGTELVLGVGVEGLVGEQRVEGVRLADGRVVPADVVVVGIGVTPTTGWLEGSGLVLDNGVVCDGFCFAVGTSDVVAAGDVARWPNPVFAEDMRVEHWNNAVQQGEAAARSLLRGREGAEPFAPVPYFWSDQYDVKIQLVGHPRPTDEICLAEGSIEERRFVAAYVRDGRVTAALAMNRPARIMAWTDVVARGAPLPPPAPAVGRTSTPD